MPPGAVASGQANMTQLVEAGGRSGARGGTRAGPVAWLAAQFTAERERWGLWLPVAFGAGIAVYFALPWEPPTWLGAAGLALAVAPALALRGRRGGWMAAVLLLAVVCAGLAAAQWRSLQVAAPVLADRFGPAAVSGQILAIEPSASGEGGGVRVTLQHVELAGLAADRTPAKVRLRLTARDPAVLVPGDRIGLRAVLRPPPAPSAPGAYDFARQAYFARLGAVGYAVGHARKEAQAPEPAGVLAGLAEDWRLGWASLRQAVAQRVLAVLPGETGAMAAALMTGERAAIPEPVIEAMRQSGLAHLLAISGLHLGLVAGLLFFAARAGLALIPPLALNHPIKKWAALVAVSGAFAYLMLVGATLPTQRAFVMIGLVFLAVLLDRTAISLRLVAWAALVVLLIAPESLLSASFQMSFAAVTALVAAYETISQRRPFAERAFVLRVLLYLAGVALTSVIAILATAPFAAYHFNRLALFGLAANLVAVPLTAFWIMPWALFAFCLMPLGLEFLALQPMGWGIDGVIGVAFAVSGLPGSVAPVPAMPAVGLALIVLGGLWLCLWRRPWRFAGLLAVAAGVLTVPLNRPPDLLVSRDAALMAVRAPDGRFWLSTTRSDRFTAEVWMRRAGATEALPWPLRGPSADVNTPPPLRCDSLGCLYRHAGHTVALVQDSRALAEDCRRASVLISREPVRRRLCRSPAVVIDRFDVWRAGAHAVWLSQEGVRVESVAQGRGERPWVLSRAR